MGIGTSIIKKYYEYFFFGANLDCEENQQIHSMEQLYTRVGDKICFGCKEYQLCKPQLGNKIKDADLLYCKKCEMFYTGEQYAILSKNFQQYI